MSTIAKKRTKPVGRARTHNEQLVVRLPVELVERVDAFRTAQAFNISRAEAVRHLLGLGLDAAGKGKR